MALPLPDARLPQSGPASQVSHHLLRVRPSRPRRCCHVTPRKGSGGVTAVDLESGLHDLMVVSLLAALAPVVAGLLARIRVPQVVILIVGGVLIGPELLDWVDPGNLVLLSNVGLGFLFLLAGYELELGLFRQ